VSGPMFQPYWESCKFSWSREGSRHLELGKLAVGDLTLGIWLIVLSLGVYIKISAGKFLETRRE